MPSAESQVAIRAVARKAIESDSPINVLVPWGSEKPDGGLIDIAELCGLKTLHKLHQSVTQYHKPGLNIHIRVEDVLAPHLMYLNPDKARLDAELYTTSFLRLNKILKLDNFITPIPESHLIDEATFGKVADDLTPVFEMYLDGASRSSLVQSILAQERLQQIGWSGAITQPMIDYYVERYKRMGLPEEEHIKTLSRYFAGALTRHNLQITGIDPRWYQDDYIQISFTPPVPGEPKHRASRRLYYRTLPENLSTNHIAPWRAKGYLRAYNDRLIPALASYQQLEDPNFRLVEEYLTLTDPTTNTSLNIRADYQVKE